MTGTRILILEHDPDLGVDLTWTLRDAGYDVVVLKDGPEGLRAAQTDPPALLLVDLLIPGTNGLDVCRRLRADPRTASLPVLLLAAQANDEANAAALAAGADVCVGRSGAASELLRQVQVLLIRESMATPRGVLEYDALVLDRTRKRVFVGNSLVRLTSTEFRLLECLMLVPGKAFSRGELVEAAVRHGDASERVVDVVIKTLRKKLRTPGLVEAVRSVGYRLRPNR
jgi:DNA-binding response OmpR family regulator